MWLDLRTFNPDDVLTELGTYTAWQVAPTPSRAAVIFDPA